MSGVPPIPLEFATSPASAEDLPPSRAEVAILGRSNVGKSTLLNALAERRSLARTSKTPGRTQLLTCYVTPVGTTVVDLPGYGYAKVSASQRHAWQQRTEQYLVRREPLVMVLLLVDGEVGPTKLDVEMLAWLRSHDVPFTVVATKHDKVRSSGRQRRKRDLATGCGVEPGDVVWVSAHKKVNIDRLRRLVHDWLA